MLYLLIYFLMGLYNMDKPKLTPRELIDKMKNEKGITFIYINEDDAETFLKEKNNYYRLAAYRKNYDKKLNGEDEDKYINLDFSYLVDLSIIDMHLRNLIFQMCVDIEHDLKVKLLNDITADQNEDGYLIVKNFIENNSYLKEEILKKRFSTYVGNLVNKFFTFDTHKNANDKIIIDNLDIRCPVWAFVEIISFGTFIKFYDYYYDLNAPNYRSLLNPVKSLRNACAHNNCLINNLRSGNTRAPQIVTQYISKIPSISRNTRQKYLSVKPMFEFCSLLIVYDKVVSKDIKRHRYLELSNLINVRMTKHSDYYKDQQLLSSAYAFIKAIIDFLIK